MGEKPKRATKTTKRDRVAAVLQVMLDGAQPHQVRQFVAEKTAAEEYPWKVAEGEKPLSERQLRRYMAEADRLIAAGHRTSHRKLLRRHLAMRRNLYARAVNAGDIGTALRIADSEAKLLDLFPSPEAELRREVEALKKQLAEIEADGNGSPTSGSAIPSPADRGPAGGAATAAAPGPD
jgi:hypothetical protein